MACESAHYKLVKVMLEAWGEVCRTEDMRIGITTFLDQGAKELEGNRDAAWLQLCHAILSSNGFLFRE